MLSWQLNATMSCTQQVPEKPSSKPKSYVYSFLHVQPQAVAKLCLAGLKLWEAVLITSELV